MTKSKSNREQAPSAKPWSQSGARKAAGKRSARQGHGPHTNTRTRKRQHEHGSDPAIQEMLLRAELKKGGVDAKIAYAKLRALKTKRRLSDEEMRNEIADRLERFCAQRKREEAEERAKIPEI